MELIPDEAGPRPGHFYNLRQRVWLLCQTYSGSSGVTTYAIGHSLCAFGDARVANEITKSIITRPLVMCD